MSQKQIRRGDICRVRHNVSLHGFPENTLVIIKECFPKRSECPTRFRAASWKAWWYVDINDITLFERGDNDEYDY